jgi:parallel beta-helix repeat protein
LERNSTHISIINNHISQNFVSNIRLEGSSYNRISNNYLSKAASASGAVSITNNSEKNILLNNVVQFNADFGFVVGSNNNTFINNTFQSTPVSFYCIGGNGFVHNNLASANRCYNNTGCNFLSCTGLNIQTNVDSIVLAPAISSCGSITSPGIYKLTNDISMSYFINTVQASTPCISIRSNYVALDCNGHTISNATTAIGVSNVINADISNCRIKGSANGIALNYVSNSNISNVAMYNNTNAALLIQNSNTDTVSNITVYGNHYGIYMAATMASLVNKFTIKNNTFGIYLSSSKGNSFTNGLAFNNTRVDAYATEDSANSSSNIMQKTKCGLSDANWASCLQYISPTLQYYPVYSCGTLSRAGTYKVIANIVGIGSSCFNIKQNDVVLDCSTHKLISALKTGPAINMTGRRNVTIANCSITGFGPAISINRSAKVSIINNNLNNSESGIVAANSRSLDIMDNNISVFNTYGLALLNTTQSHVLSNKVNRNPQNNIGIFLNDSALNQVLNNTVTSTTGMYIAGHSNNNTISNNLVQSGSTDYICSKENSPINAEYGGINYGTNKQGCLWLAAVLQSSPNVACTSTINPTIYSLTNDYVYNTGETCFNIYSNNTLINCNGHTIIATNGGTFINFIKSQNSNLQNCNLKGFSSPIKA